MIKKIIIGILCFLLVIALSIYLLLTTQTGMKLALDIVVHEIPGKINLEQVQGRLLDHLSIKQVVYNNDGMAFTIKELHAQWNLWHIIHGQVKVNTQWQSLHASIDGQRIDTTKGSLEAEGTTRHYVVTGATTTQINQQPAIPWQLKAYGNLQQLTIESFNATVLDTKINLKGLVKLSPQLAWDIQLSAANFNPQLLAPNLSGRITMRVATTGHMHHAEQLNALIKLQQLSGTLNQLPLHGQGQLRYQGSTLIIDHFKLNYGDARVSITGQAKNEWSLQWNARVPNLMIFNPQLHGQMTVTGVMTGTRLKPQIKTTIQAQQLKYQEHKINRIDAKLNYTLGETGQLLVNAAKISAGSNEDVIKLLTTHINWSTKQPVLKTTLTIKIDENPPITGQFNLPQLLSKQSWKQQAITGTINFSMKDLTYLSDVLPQLDHTRGTMTANINISGTLGKPHITGSASLQQGQVTIKPLGITLKKVSAKLATGIDGQLNYHININSGDGSLLIKGHTKLLEENYPTELNIEGHGFQVVNNREARVEVDPKLKITTEDNHISLTGSITIPKARITPDDFTTTTTLSKDVVFVGAKPEQPPFNVTSNVHLILGNDIQFSYGGVNATLTGNLQLRDNSKGMTTANGQLSTKKGSFTGYGQQLTITQGQLIYTGGPINDPNLNIEASKAVKILSTKSQSGNDGKKMSTIAGSQEVTVGVQINGSLDEPKLTLFSRPSSLSQADILSYLVLGTSTDNVSSGDASALLSALPLLTSRGNDANMTRKQLENKLGVKVNVSSEQEYDAKSESVVENTSLVLSKTLSPKLFVDYGIGLVKSVNTLRVGYKVTPRLTLRTEASTNANGIDILYSIEKD